VSNANFITNQQLNCQFDVIVLKVWKIDNARTKSV